MKTKHLLILACIVIVLGIIYALQQGSRKNGSDFVERRELVPSISAATVSLLSSWNKTAKPLR